MKKHFLYALSGIALLSSSILISSCDTEQGIEVKFNQDMEYVVEILPQTALSIDTTLELTSNLDSVLTANDATRDDLGSLTLASIDVSRCDSLGVDDYNLNFNNYDSVAINVFVPNDNTVPNVLVAQSSVPTSMWGFGVGLTQSDFDFVPYATKNSFSIRYRNKLKAPLTSKNFVKVKIRLNVGVNI